MSRSQFELHFDLSELVSRYCECIDDHRLREFGDLFTEDGVLDTNGQSVARGRSEIVSTLEAALPEFGLRHYVSNLRVVGGEPEPASVAYWVTYRLTDDAPVINLIGRYRHWYRRVDDSWLFSRIEAEYFNGDWHQQVPLSLR